MGTVVESPRFTLVSLIYTSSADAAEVNIINIAIVNTNKTNDLLSNLSIITYHLDIFVSAQRSTIK